MASRSEEATSFLQGLPEGETAKFVGDAVGQLSAGAQEATASEIFNLLDAPRQTAQVVESIKSLPTGGVEEAVGAGLDQLPVAQLEDAATKALGSLPAAAQQRVVGGLSAPDAETNRWLWKVVVGSLIAIVVIFGVLAFVLIYQKKSAEAPLALATTALGGIVGLLAPGPNQGSGKGQ